MTAAAPADAAAPARPPAFAPRTVLALVLVGLVALAGLAVLSAYAPELRSGNDGRAHALSKSAIGYAGAPILMRAMGETVVVSRMRAHDYANAAVVLTPEFGTSADALKPFRGAAVTLYVLPKWAATEDPLHAGFVRKVGVMPVGEGFTPLFADYAKATRLINRKGIARPALRGAGGPFAPGTYLPLGPIDRLQTVSGEGWGPALTDETGAIVLAYARKNPSVLLLADPDLLNNQGLKSLDTARAGAAILDTAAAGGARPILFDVTLNGLGRERGLWRLMLQPPWLAATLIAVAAGVLMGLHALARFGQPRRGGRAFALGARALVDNSADLFRMARKEAELAPAYAQLSQALVVKAGGGHAPEGWLSDLARRRGVADPAALAADADKAKTRDDLMAVARKLYEWRGEMTRERR